MKYCFIINPISGRSGSAVRHEQTIRDILGRKSISFQILTTQARGHAKDLARRAAGEGFAVVAVGGDGTVNEVGSALIGSGAIMGIIPKGSGNGLASELGIPLEPETACRMLLESKILEIDAGRLNERHFINMAGLGLDAQVGIAFDRHHMRGKLPYYYLTLRELFYYKSPAVLMEIDGRERRLNPLLIAIANGKQYGDGAQIAPKARLDDGIFHITVIPRLPFWKFLACVPRLFNGTLDQHPEVATLTATSLILRLPHPMPYHVDGEPFCDATELNISLLPKALKILAPKKLKA